MNEAEKSFEQYMDEVIIHARVTGKRRIIWSIPRCVLAREVWMECMRRQNDASTGKRAEVGCSQVQG